jgi:peptide/nickel transport system ATP-binding protein
MYETHTPDSPLLFKGESSPILSIKNLEVWFDTVQGPVCAVRDVSFDLHAGEILGLVGETGSGKSVTCKAVTQLLPDTAKVRGEILFHETNLTKVPKHKIVDYRGKAISMIFQDPQGSLHPIKTILGHMKEVIKSPSEKFAFTGLLSKSSRRKESIRKTAKKQLKAVHITSPGKRLRDYPFQFSGGMAQRVQIAMAMSGEPEILIADEPSTALDVTIQARILNEIKRLSREKRLAVVLITHDLGVVAEICDRVAVMYHGRIVETGNVKEILAIPSHPYTQALLASVPIVGKRSRQLKPISGESLASETEVSGCDFADRCFHVHDVCLNRKPQLQELADRRVLCFFPLKGAVDLGLNEEKKERVIDRNAQLLQVQELTCRFKAYSESGEKEFITAVDKASFSIRKGEIFGIVGESGSGKSTLAKAVMGMLPPGSGEIVFKGQQIFTEGWSLKRYAAAVQYVFQDPLGALDPRMAIIRQVAEPLAIHGSSSAHDALERAAGVLKSCGLNESFFYRKPYNLSGGQRQRAVLARALINNPELLICDEPVSAMDVSVQAQILNLIESLAYERKMTVLFISHDLSVINNICDRVAIMFAGQIVEIGPLDSIFTNPSHPYTKSLMQAIPKIGASSNGSYDSDKQKIDIAGKEADDDVMISGCVYARQCTKADKDCLEKRPEMTSVGDEHEAACFHLT